MPRRRVLVWDAPNIGMTLSRCSGEGPVVTDQTCGRCSGGSPAVDYRTHVTRFLRRALIADRRRRSIRATSTAASMIRGGR